MELVQELSLMIERLLEKQELIKALEKHGLSDLYPNTLHQFGLVLPKNSCLSQM